MPTFVIGPYPPPLHGASKNTRLIAMWLAQETDVVRISTSVTRSSCKFGRLHYLRQRLMLTYEGITTLLRHKTKLKNIVYICPDAGHGLLLSAMLIVTGAIIAPHIYIHHRSYAYLNDRSIIMTILCLLLSHRITHIFLSDGMNQLFRIMYRTNGANFIVSNAAMYTVQPCRTINPESASVNSRTIQIGYLSNIIAQKGFPEFLLCVQDAIDAGIEIRAHIAGPTTDPQCGQLLGTAQSQLPEHIVYHGPLYGSKKETFFDDIDIFIFPTKYRNEAEPNVILEAMRAGCLVLSTPQGCIPEILADDAGIVADLTSFRSASLRALSMAAADPDWLRERCSRSAAHFQELARRGSESKEALLNALVSVGRRT